MGRPKGWLPAPSEGLARPVSVIERTLAILRAQCDEVVLVGRADPYLALGLRSIDDATTASGRTVEGPLSGLVALLERTCDATVVVVACDMPYVTAAMVARLATFADEAPAVAARDDSDPGRTAWSPLFARYEPARVAGVARAKLEEGHRSLRVVLESVDARELPLSEEERRALRDWDAPSDIDLPRSR